MQFPSYNDLPRRTFEERVSGDETVEKSRASQMVLDICGRYDTACFYLFFLENLNVKKISARQLVPLFL